ncbi:GIY-YIG nuclease family protein [Xanthobacter versatilis]|uniref:GIY-YIG nuclease family protein n=1 Tax=Xanthobacter autotrophicus (strain ATCC BAA-1158 / Py2) TaxID=78245 RepID=UPI00372C2A36
MSSGGKRQGADQEQGVPAGPYAIYSLSGEDGVPRYVGKTNNPRRRLGQHVSSSFWRRSAKDRWVAEVSAAGTLKMTVIEWCEDWAAAEVKWIAHGRQVGWPLLNVADGGDDSDRFTSPEFRARARESKYRKAMAQLQLCEMEAKSLGMIGVAANLRIAIDRLKRTARQIRSKCGEDKFAEWAEWLYNELPIDHVRANV